MVFHHGVDRVARRLEEQAEIWRKSGDVIAVLVFVSALDPEACLYSPFVPRTKRAISVRSFLGQVHGTHDFLSPALPLDISAPPISPLIRQLIPIDADLPAILPWYTLPSKGEGDDLMPEAHADDLHMLGGG